MRFFGFVLAFVLLWTNLFVSVHTVQHASYHGACRICAASDQLDESLKESDLALVSVLIETEVRCQKNEEKILPKKSIAFRSKPLLVRRIKRDSLIVVPAFIPLGYHAIAPPYRFI